MTIAAVALPLVAPRAFAQPASRPGEASRPPNSPPAAGPSVAPSAVATQPGAAAASQPINVPDGKMRIVIAAVTGIVQVREDENAKWKKAEVGMVLDEGAEFRTGPRSAVQIAIPPDQSITLDRLGVMKVLTALKEQGKIKTDVGMKYGRTRYDIEATGTEHEATVRSPASTLAIRGTRTIIQDEAGFAPSVIVWDGRGQYRNLANQLVSVGTKTSVGKLTGDKSSPAATALVDTQGPAAAQLPADTSAKGDLPANLAIFSGLDFTGLGILENIELARRGAFAGTFIGVLPFTEDLLFSISWQGAPGSDVDLSVKSPLGEVVNAAHPTSKSGGAFESNNVADGTGFGFENVRWVGHFPQGTFTYTATYKGNTPPVFLDVQVIRDPDNKAILLTNISGRQLGAGQPTSFSGSVKAP